MARKTTIARRRRARPGHATNADGIALGPLANWVGFNLRMAQETAFQSFSKLSREIGEHPGRFAILTLIRENPGISQTTLSNAAGRDKSSLTPVLEEMVRRGLVQRDKTAKDRRAYRLSLTPSGSRTLTKMLDCAQVYEDNLDRAVGSRDRARFLQALKRIAAALS